MSQRRISYLRGMNAMAVVDFWGLVIPLGLSFPIRSEISENPQLPCGSRTNHVKSNVHCQKMTGMSADEGSD